MNIPDEVREDLEDVLCAAEDARIYTERIRAWLDSQPTAPEPDWRVLRAALAALVGADTKEELDMMEMAIRSTAAPDKDKAVAINAIDALRETLPEGK